MTRKAASNPFEQMILDNICRYGWHSNSVGTALDASIFAYTVGFFHSYRHPELLVFGLTPESAHGLFTAAARMIARGRALDTSTPTEELLVARACIPVDVPRRFYAEFATSARWYYNGNRFPMYQVVWPSDDGLYPWNPKAPDAFVREQPVLGRYSTGA